MMSQSMSPGRDENATDKHPSPPVPWRIYLLVGTVGLLLAGVVGYGLYVGVRMSTMYAPLVDAAMEIKLEATTAHLLSEEILSGDRDEDIEVVWKHLDQADWYAQAMLEGGTNPEGTFIPLDDAGMRQAIIGVQERLAQFRETTRQRMAATETSGAGTEIYRRHHAEFAAFINGADDVETRLQQVIARELQRFRATEIVLILTCLLLSLFVGVALHRFERRQAQSLLAVRDANESLEMEITERVQAASQRDASLEALRHERDNLVRVFEAMEDGVYVVDQQYDIQYVNPVLVKEFGPYQDRKCYAYFHDRDEVCPWCKNQDVLAGKTVRWEWYSVKNQRTYDLIDTPLRNADGSVSKLEIFRDITERVQAESQRDASLEALRASELRLREAQRVGAVGNWEFDVETQRIDWSEQVYRLFERDPAQGPPTYEENMAYYHPEDSERLQEQVRRAIELGEESDTDYRLNLPGGKLVYQEGLIRVGKDENGGVTRLYGTVHDITDRVQAQEQIQASLREKTSYILSRGKLTDFEGKGPTIDNTSTSVLRIGISKPKKGGYGIIGPMTYVPTSTRKDLERGAGRSS